MDIMRPKLQRVGNMCFRRLDLLSDGNDLVILNNKYNDNTCDDNSNDNCLSFSGENDSKQSICDNKTETQTNKIDLLEQLEEMDSEDDTIQEVNAQNGKRYRLELRIAKTFHGLVIGKKAFTKRVIESDTKTLIEVPKETDLRSAIVITGSTRSDVKSAKRRINSIVDSMRSKSDFTHFVSIPMNENSIQEKFNEFKKEVLNDSDCMKARGMDECLFELSHKLHITIATLLLSDENERNLAAQVLEECDRNFIKSSANGKPIRVRVEGIDYMNDDPSQVDVIYAKIKDLTENECLQPIMNDIYTHMEDIKLMTRSHDFQTVNETAKVKAHITLMNTKFRQKESSKDMSGRDSKSRNAVSNKRETFDATALIKRFGHYYFGEVCIQTIEISIRHSKGRGKDGYYSHTSLINV